MIVALAARRLKVPYTVALVGVGLCLAQTHVLALPVISKGLVYSQFALRGTAERFPSKWGLVVTWSGLRGALSMLLALSLPRDFVDRELLIAMTFGVVLLSLFVQGLTVAPLLSRLGLKQSSEP